MGTFVRPWKRTSPIFRADFEFLTRQWGDAAGTNNNVRDGGASTAILGDGDDIWYLNTDYGEIEHGIIENVHYKNSKLDMFTVRFDNGDIDSFDGCWFGKTFFQTKEKAKNAMLQERK